MLGRYKLSHMPYKFSDDVPATAKSSVKHSAPIKSEHETYGLPVSSNPAMTGSQNHGENLRTKNLEFREV